MAMCGSERVVVKMGLDNGTNVQPLTALWIPATVLYRCVSLWWSECSSVGARGCDAQQVTSSREGGIPRTGKPLCGDLVWLEPNCISFERG